MLRGFASLFTLPRSHLLFLIAVYGLTHFFFLFMIHPTFEYWPWYFHLENRNLSLLMKEWSRYGYPLWPVLHAPFAFAPNVIVSVRLSSLVSQAVTGLLFSKVLKEVLGFRPIAALSGGLLSFLLPFYLVGFELPFYTWLMMFFMIGFYSFFLLLKNETLYSKNKKKWMRLLSILSFFIGFNLNSTLTLYGVIPILILSHSYSKGHSILQNVRSTLRMGVRYLDFILLPLFFWFLKLYVVPFKSLAEGYNQPRIDMKTFYDTFYSPVTFAYQLARVIKGEMISFHPLFSTALILSFILVIFGLAHRENGFLKIGASRLFALFLIGLLLLYLGTFPYVATHRPFNFGSYGSRTSILAVYGFSVMLLVILESTLWVRFGQKLYLLGLSLLMGFLTTYHMKLGVNWILDDVRISSLMYHMKDSPEIRNASIVEIDDQFQEFNGNGRVLRMDELAGIFKKVFGDEKRYGFQSGIDVLKNVNDWIDDGYSKGLYLMKDMKPCGVYQKIVVTKGQVDKWSLFSIRFVHPFREDPLRMEQIKSMSKIDYAPAAFVQCPGAKN